ncbi:MAG: HpcH/HpaI aldolase/citrate lyase family protein [Candidatus Velthaea sp.]
MTKLRDALANDGVAVGVGLPFATPQMVEIAGRIGFHWCLLDGEHGAIAVSELERAAIAADFTGISAMARPAANRPELILHALDRGVAGVQVPHIANAAEADAVVRAAKYEPRGARGLAGSMRSGGYGIDFNPAAYVERANRETVVCVQIEDDEGLANAADIAAVDGVDIVFLGPMDLSQALGHPGDFSRADFRAKVERAFAAIRDAGKVAGTSGSIAWVEYAVGAGARYVYTNVNTLLVSAGRDFMGKFAGTRP